MDVVLTIGRFFYDGTHVVSVLMTSFLMGPALAAVSLGPGVWGLSALWLALLVLDRTGRANLHGSVGKLLAGLLLPAAMGSGELLYREDLFGEAFPLEVHLCFYMFLLLLGNCLLRGPGGQAGPPMHRAELLLERGCELAIPEVLWLNLLGGAVFLVTVFGFVIVIILGELMAQNGSIFDYGGLGGVLAALLALHLAQSLMFWRGLHLARQEEPDLSGRYSLLLWVPAANLFWAGRLRSRLWKRRMERENPAWNQL